MEGNLVGLRTPKTQAGTNGHSAVGLRAAIYCRVSTDRQEREGASLDTQLKDCSRFCETKGLLPVAQYIETESGLNSDRAEYQKLLQEAREGHFDTLIVWRMDRLGRDAADYFGALKTLRRSGVAVQSATEPTDNPFVQGLFGLLGEEESRRLSLRVIPNKRARAAEGKWNGPAPFGYDVVKIQDGKGSVLVPNADVPIVQELFERYASGGSSLGDLVRYLPSLGRKLTRAGLNRILRNPVYLGKVVYGTYARSPFSASPEIVEAQGLHQPIVSEDIFTKVQGRLSANHHRQRGGPHPKFLLSGLVRCGKCNSPMSGRRTKQRWVQYICCRKTTYEDCDNRSISALRLEPPVKSQVTALLEPVHLATARAEAKGIVEQLLAQDRMAHGRTRESLLRQNHHQEERLTSLENALLDGLVRPHRYLARRDEIIAEIQKIEQQLSALPPTPDLDLDELFTLVDNITWDDLDHQAWRELIETLVERVVVKDTTMSISWRPICQPLLAISDAL